MKALTHKATHFLIGLWLVATISAGAQDTVPKDIVGKEFALPVMKDGEKSMLVRGKTVKSFGAFINLSGLQIQLYPTKKMDALVRLFSPEASYDTTKEAASSKAKVNIRALHPVNAAKGGKPQYQTVIDGTGFDFSNAKRQIGIRSKVVARMFPKAQKVAKPVGDGIKVNAKALGDRTKITAKRLDYHFAEQPGIISFFGNVDGAFSNTSIDKKTGKAETEQFTLKADTLVIKQGLKRSVDTFKATGSVTVTQLTGSKLVATGETANCVFGTHTMVDEKTKKTVTVKTRIVRLTGDPVLTTPQWKLTGAEVVVIKKVGNQPPEAFTQGGPSTITILSDADKKWLSDLTNPEEKKSSTPKEKPTATEKSPRPKSVPKKTPDEASK